MIVVVLGKRKIWSFQIDEEDWGRVRGFRWHVDSLGYVAGYVNGNQVRLHRHLMEAGRGQIVDHKNRDQMDNRKGNLRLASKSENGINSKHRKHNTSGFRGVHFCRQTGKWRAEIRKNGQCTKLGRFKTKLAAALAYDQAALDMHGDFATTNFLKRDYGKMRGGCEA
jgi:hypothetical protein